MSEFVGLIGVAVMIVLGLWIAQHEAPRQEILTAIVLIIVSIIVIAISLKTLSSEN